MIDRSFYFNVLYPLQNEVLRLIHLLDTEFYLTGGTATSRGYLNHRFSDDLDLFVNDSPQFLLWSERIIQALNQSSKWQCNVLNRDEHFIRLVLSQQQNQLKIELINDVPAHVGKIEVDTTLGRLDSKENILANKITALLGREEPKDLADVWGFCCQHGMSINDAISNAQSKAAGIFPPDLARVLDSVSYDDWQVIRWIDAPEANKFISDLKKLAEKLILLS
jgi:predicted nucleotidyltransferase component of viral defense system